MIVKISANTGNMQVKKKYILPCMKSNPIYLNKINAPTNKPTGIK